MSESLNPNPPPQAFEFSDYRKYLQSLSSFWRQNGGRQTEFAKAMRCQPAYLSQVLKEKAHLTEDQVLLLAEFLALKGDDTEYFLNLLRLAKAATPSLKNYLENTRLALLERLRELDGRLASKKERVDPSLLPYYSSDWLPAAIHIATSCKDLQDVESIAKRFMVAESMVKKHLEKLQQFGLVVKRKDKWIYKNGSLHISKDSLYDNIFQVSRRLLALDSLKKRTERDVHYSVTYATDASTQQKLKKKIINFIESLHQEVEPSPAHDVYSMTIDLFRV